LYSPRAVDAEIQGVEAHVPDDNKNAETFEADYFAEVRRLMQQKLNRIPKIDNHSERIGEKTVFVLKVEEGATQPYFNVQTREIFIRRGASDVRPDPDKDLRMMVTSGGSLELLPVGLSQ
jgi:predicted HTH transcriptional regulator